MTRNPIYQALLRTRIMSKMTRDYRADPRLGDKTATFERDMEAIRELRERGILSYEECSGISHRVARSYHAAVLTLFRADNRLAARRRLNRQVIRFHAEGIRL